ncbi:MAG: GxxExxY protein [Treponema sp.]|nr:GxxExxY protein [Treponema sp.]
MIIESEKTEKIIKACMNVHNELGNGFLEAVYQSALEIEFSQLGIPYKKECKINVIYKGHVLDKVYYADFICYNSIILEIKATSCLISSHKAQLLNYLHATHLQIGFLINFGEKSLKWNRVTTFS